MIHATVFDAKPYDREFLPAAPEADGIRWHFRDFRCSAETAAAAAGSQAVCVFVNDTLDRPCLERLLECGVRHIALRCAGFDRVDLDAAKALGITVTRVPAYSPNAVAEHSIALLLTLNRRIHRAWNRVREHNFSLHGLIGFDIFGRTAGILGTGKIGRVAAQILRGFGASVIAYDPVPSPGWAAAHGVRYVGMEEVLRSSDILMLHLPLTPESHHLLNADTFARLKPGAIVVNTSRGKLIDTTALLQALKSGHLGGVALDVYEEEEGVFFEDRSGTLLDDDELNLLLSYPNVLVTAHQGFLTREALCGIARVTAANILRAESRSFLEGTRLA